MKKGIEPPLYELNYLDDSHELANHPKLWYIKKTHFEALRRTAEYRTAIGDDRYPFRLVRTGLKHTKLEIKKDIPLEILAQLNNSVAIALCEDRILLLRQKKPELFKAPLSDYIIDAASDLLKLVAIEEHVDFVTKRILTGISPNPPYAATRLLREIYRLFSPELLNAQYLLTLPDLPKGIIGPRIETPADEEQFNAAIRKAKGENLHLLAGSNELTDKLRLPMLPIEPIDLPDTFFERLGGGEK